MYSEKSACLNDVYEGEKYRFRKKKRLGAGGNGTVYEVEIEGYQGEPLVAKFFYWKNKKRIYQERYERFKEEVKFLEENPGLEGIIPIIDKQVPAQFPTTKDGAWYLMPKGEEYKPATKKDFVDFLDDMLYLAETLRRLHNKEPKCAHRDIKPDNILLYHDKPCLCDWGLLWRADGKHITGKKEKVGPITILPPELEKGDRKYNLDLCKSDVYLFAKVLWIFIKKDRHVFSGPYRRGEENIYLRKEALDLPTLEPIHQLMLGATQRDLSTRINIEKCIELLEQQKRVSTIYDEPVPSIQEEIRQLRFNEHMEEMRSRDQHSAETYTDEVIMTEVLAGIPQDSNGAIYLNIRNISREAQTYLKFHIHKREGKLFELYHFIGKKQISYWFIPQSIIFDREKYEIIVSVMDIGNEQKPEGTVSYRDSLNPMNRGITWSTYLEAGNAIVIRG